jgi:hypothetical protein
MRILLMVTQTHTQTLINDSPIPSNIPTGSWFASFWIDSLKVHNFFLIMNIHNNWAVIHYNMGRGNIWLGLLFSRMKSTSEKSFIILRTTTSKKKNIIQITLCQSTQIFAFWDIRFDKHIVVLFFFALFCCFSRLQRFWGDKIRLW